MFPFGVRQASGGRKADHYSWYSGVGAEDEEGISILFEQAEVSLLVSFTSALCVQAENFQILAIILETARAVHPKLVSMIKEQSEQCEKLGVAGVNLFSCNGYTAPQHFDVDAVRSLCAQFEHKAKSKWSEFGFCALQYGYYIETRANTLWFVFGDTFSVKLADYFSRSFDSGCLHGTMLPSENTIQRLRGGANSTASTTSTGIHPVVRLRDQRRASRAQHIRDNYPVLERAWRRS